MSGLRWLLCGLSELLESDASLAFGQEERPAGQTSASGPHPVCTLLFILVHPQWYTAVPLQKSQFPPKGTD